MFRAKIVKLKSLFLSIQLLAYMLLAINRINGQTQDLILSVNLRGVYESKISLIPLAGANAFKPISTFPNLKNGDNNIQIPTKLLPGEFVLRFDYKENITSIPYPAEMRIILNKQDIQLWVNPIYCNNTDSTWFQENESENNSYLNFLQENVKQKKMLELLQNFLLNYDNPKSAFYKDGIKEYEKRRKNYNLWISNQIQLKNELFASKLFGFQRIPYINWDGNEAERNQSLRDNYFNNFDFNDTILLKTSNLKEWMDHYVNLFGKEATSLNKRDSLFTLAGQKVLEKAQKGNPKIFGWMLDYLYNGYESINISKGMLMLEKYVNDPNCEALKKEAILKRIESFKILAPGLKAPNFVLNDPKNKLFELYKHKTDKKYMLILFWSADCGHCVEIADKLQIWYETARIRQNLEIIAISLDKTETELIVWKKKINELADWIHLSATKDNAHTVISDFYIQGVPSMFLIDSETKIIEALPENIEQLESAMHLN